MKKTFGIYAVFICLAVILGMNGRTATVQSGDNGGAYEYYNDEGLQMAARKAGLIDGVREVAIIGYKKNVLAGVVLEMYDDEIETAVRAMVEGNMAADTRLFLEVNTELAEKIVELSYFADSKLPKRVVKGRFNAILHQLTVDN